MSPLRDVLERSVADASREPNYSRQVADGPRTFEDNPWLNTTKHPAAATNCVADVLTNSWALQTTTHSVWASTRWTGIQNTSVNTSPNPNDGGRQAQPAAIDFTSMVVQLRARARTDMVFAALLNFKSSSLTCQQLVLTKFVYTNSASEAYPTGAGHMCATTGAGTRRRDGPNNRRRCSVHSRRRRNVTNSCWCCVLV